MDHLVNIRIVNKSQQHQFIKKIPFQTTDEKKRMGKNSQKKIGIFIFYKNRSIKQL